MITTAYIKGDRWIYHESSVDKWWQMRESDLSAISVAHGLIYFQFRGGGGFSMTAQASEENLKALDQHQLKFPVQRD